MTSDQPPKTVEELNLEKILVESTPWPTAGFDERLAKAVLAQVASSRRRRPVVKRLVRPLWAVAAAACAVTAFFAYRLIAVPVAGEVNKLYGIVTVANGHGPREIAGKLPLYDGHRVYTEWGSKARIVLADSSTLVTMPGTLLRVNDTPGGARVILDRGGIGVTAAKQHQGKALVIETPIAEVRVLGTILDVREGTVDGHRQTRVSVDRGSVQLTSGPKSVTILPNMEGIVEEGKAPVAQALTAEVSEIARLIDVGHSFSKPIPNLGLPAMVDFNDDGSSDVWLALPVESRTARRLVSAPLVVNREFTGMEVYSLDGAFLPAELRSKAVEVDLTRTAVRADEVSMLVARFKGVKDVFGLEASGGYSFRGASEGPATSLVEFRLPISARLVTAPPEVERGVIMNRNILVLALKMDPAGILERK